MQRQIRFRVRPREALTAFVVIAVCGSSWIAIACSPSVDVGNADLFDDSGVPTWRLSANPLLTVGGEDERDGFAIENVAGATMLGSLLVVADAGFHQVRFYALDGTLVANVGRDGSGPGEFRVIRGITASSDSSVAVWDVQLGRLTTLNADGRVLGTVGPDLSGARSIRPRFVGITDGGGSVFVDEVPSMTLRSERTGQRRDSVRYLFIEPDGSWTGSARAEPGTEMYFVNEVVTWGQSEVLFGRSTVHCVSGGRVVVGNTDSLAVWQLDGTGSIIRAASFEWQPQVVAADWVPIARENLSERTERPSSSLGRLNVSISGGVTIDALDLATERRVADTPSRATTPAFGRLMGNVRGDTWMAEYDTPNRSQTRWIGLDSTLTPFAQIAIEEEASVLELGRSFAVIKSEDEWGRESIHVFAVVR